MSHQCLFVLDFMIVLQEGGLSILVGSSIYRATILVRVQVLEHTTPSLAAALARMDQNQLYLQQLALYQQQQQQEEEWNVYYANKNAYDEAQALYGSFPCLE